MSRDRQRTRERETYFSLRNDTVGEKYNPAIDPIDDIRPSGQTGSHYSRNRQVRYPDGLDTRDQTDAYHEDAEQVERLKGVYQSTLDTQTERVRGRRPSKLARLARKDGLDKQAHETLLGPAQDLRRTQERYVNCFNCMIKLWN